MQTWPLSFGIERLGGLFSGVAGALSASWLARRNQCVRGLFDIPRFHLNSGDIGRCGLPHCRCERSGVRHLGGGNSCAGEAGRWKNPGLPGGRLGGRAVSSACRLPGCRQYAAVPAGRQFESAKVRWRKRRQASTVTFPGSTRTLACGACSAGKSVFLVSLSALSLWRRATGKQAIAAQALKPPFLRVAVFAVAFVAVFWRRFSTPTLRLAVSFCTCFYPEYSRMRRPREGVAVRHHLVSPYLPGAA